MATVDEDNGLVLLVWDAPNMDATLEGIHADPPADGPALDVVRRWLESRSPAGSEVEASLFTELIQGEEERPLEFLVKVRNSGFRIFVKPREVGAPSELDNEILRHIARRRSGGNLVEVIVASHDGGAFGEALEALAAEGVRATVVAFREFAHFARERDEIELVDIEDDIGAFSDRLPRMRLWEVPSEGSWFEATGFPDPTSREAARRVQRATPPTPMVTPTPMPTPTNASSDLPGSGANDEGSRSSERDRIEAEPTPDENVVAAAVTRHVVTSPRAHSTGRDPVPPPPQAGTASPIREVEAPAPPPPPAPTRVVGAGREDDVVAESEMELTDLDADDESDGLADFDGAGIDDEMSASGSDQLGSASGVFDYPEGATASLSRRNIRRRRQLRSD